MYNAEYISPIGKLTMCSDGEALVGLWLEGQKYFGGTCSDIGQKNQDLKIFQEVTGWLDEYFQGNQSEIGKLPLKPFGNEFRQTVWKILCEIPYGETITYGDIAQKIARQRNISKMSAQAVGSAVGHNPISIIIPCHRVVGKNGNLTGYAGGLNAKKFLLNLEHAL